MHPLTILLLVKVMQGDKAPVFEYLSRPAVATLKGRHCGALPAPSQYSILVVELFQRIPPPLAVTQVLAPDF